MRYLIDTNVFLRVLYEESAKTSAECVSFLSLLKTNDVNAYTSSLVLAEIDWVLKSNYKVEKRNRARSLKYVKDLNGLRIVDKVSFKKALDYYNNTKAKFVDCLLASKLEKDTIIVSYDKDFDKLQYIKRQTPGEVVKTLNTL